jgi:hypothetical protein
MRRTLTERSNENVGAILVDHFVGRDISESKSQPERRFAFH